MQNVPSERGEMSQDSGASSLHPEVVTSRRRPAIDPAARTGKRAYDALSASSVGIELGLSVIIGLLIGYYLDQKLGTQPWLMLVMLCFGLVAGFRGVLRAVKRAERAAEADVHG
jgi:F0F1-type ATP synthase assembly protein I